MAILDPDTRRSSAFLTRCAAALFVCALTVPAAAVHLVPSSSASTVAGQVDPRPLAALDKAAEGSPQPPARPGTAPAESAPPAQAATPPNPALRTVADESLRRTLSRALIEFAGDGDIDGIAGMLAAGAEINAQVDGDGSALIAAAGDGHLDAMRFLLDRGADPNLAVAGEGTALIAAAGDGHVDVVRLLLDRGADPNVAVEGEGTALIAAADDGHLEVVDLLLQRGAQINQVVEGDETALIKAAGEGDLEMVKLLVSRGADVNLGVTTYERAFRIGFRGDLDVSVDREVRTPLSEARDDGHVDVVTFLISAGARD